jgi:hypothetical protein
MTRRRPTTACSDLDHHKMHAPDCHARLKVSDCALQVGRPVADAGRWATETLRSKPGHSVVQACSESSPLEPKATKTQDHDEATLKNYASDVCAPRDQNPTAMEVREGSAIPCRKLAVHKVPTGRAVASRFRPRPSPSPLASEWCRHVSLAPTGKACACGTRVHVALSGLHSWPELVERHDWTDAKRAGHRGVLESAFGSPNNYMQRAGTHKVLGRGRSAFSPLQVRLARVLNRRRAVADERR